MGGTYLEAYFEGFKFCMYTVDGDCYTLIPPQEGISGVATPLDIPLYVMHLVHQLGVVYISFFTC